MRNLIFKWLYKKQIKKMSKNTMTDYIVAYNRTNLHTESDKLYYSLVRKYYVKKYGKVSY
ncbi:MAG: hypothetical protein K6E87_04575 [bacterium]|nr:hypothetical protein [bacterium]